jgi:hypothetical protein
VGVGDLGFEEDSGGPGEVVGIFFAGGAGTASKSSYIGFLDCKRCQCTRKVRPTGAETHVWPFNRLCMQNSFWEKSYPDHNSAGSYGRKTLLSVSSHSISKMIILACRRNNLEAMAQLTLMWASIEE